ncbi:hypothetical protein CVT24_000141 [Panaeolus cyanescens]|uniref:MHD domain-containing protein n=1 Tax=Panaeolus cyanescens TaxID=181874 RepID=A0A409VS92_9AGAR|nr:hypothetical protein CVT24_000141 [Panaeolus cyanescens]
MSTENSIPGSSPTSTDPRAQAVVPRSKFPVRSETAETAETTPVLNSENLEDSLTSILKITAPLLVPNGRALLHSSVEFEFLVRYSSAVTHLDRTISKSLAKALRIHSFLDRCQRYIFELSKSNQSKLDDSEIPSLASLFGSAASQAQQLIGRFDDFVNRLDQAFEQAPADLKSNSEIGGQHTVIPILDEPDKSYLTDVFRSKTIPELSGSPSSTQASSVDRLYMAVFYRKSLVQCVKDLQSWWYNIHALLSRLPNDLSSLELNLSKILAQIDEVMPLFSQYIHGVHLPISSSVTRFKANDREIQSVVNEAARLGFLSSNDTTIKNLRALDWSQASKKPFDLFVEPSIILQETKTVPLTSALLHRTRIASADITAKIPEVHRLHHEGHFAIKLEILSGTKLEEEAVYDAQDVSTNPHAGAPASRCTRMDVAWNLGCEPGYNSSPHSLSIVKAFPKNIVTNTTDVRWAIEKGWTIEPTYTDISAGSVHRTDTVEFVIPKGLRLETIGDSIRTPSGYQLRWNARENPVLKEGLSSFELLAIIKLHDISTREISTNINIMAHFAGEQPRSLAWTWKGSGKIKIGGQDDRRINLPLYSLDTSFRIKDPQITVNSDLSVGFVQGDGA